MAASKITCQLEAILHEAERVLLECRKIGLVEKDWDIVHDRSVKLGRVTIAIENEIRSRKCLQIEQERNELRSAAAATIKELLTTGQFERPSKFRKNILTLYNDLEISVFDSNRTKVRKASTRQRIETVKELNCDGIISWAVAFVPSSWTAGRFSDDMFESLVDRIEPEHDLVWPNTVSETLNLLLKDNKGLQSSPKYHELLQGQSFAFIAKSNTNSSALKDKSSGISSVSRKRRRVEDQSLHSLPIQSLVSVRGTKFPSRYTDGTDDLLDRATIRKREAT